MRRSREGLPPTNRPPPTVRRGARPGTSLTGQWPFSLRTALSQAGGRGVRSLGGGAGPAAQAQRGRRAWGALAEAGCPPKRPQRRSGAHRGGTASGEQERWRALLVLSFLALVRGCNKMVRTLGNCSLPAAACFLDSSEAGGQHECRFFLKGAASRLPRFVGAYIAAPGRKAAAAAISAGGGAGEVGTGGSDFMPALLGYQQATARHLL